MPEQNLKKQTANAILWSTIQNWGSRLLSTFIFFFLAKFLGPEDFGLIALASVFISLTQVLVEQGFTVAIVQRKFLEDGLLDTAFWINLSLGCTLCATFFFLAGPISIAFEESQLKPIIRALSLIFILVAMRGVQEGLLLRSFHFKALALRITIATLVGGTIGIVSALNGLGVWSLVLQQIMNELVGILVLWWVSDWYPRFKFSPTYAKELFSFGSNILGTRLLTFFSKQTDNLLIGYYLGPVQLGYYTIGYRVLDLTTSLLFGIAKQVSLSTFSRLQGEREKIINAFYRATQLASFIAFPICFSIAVMSSELIQAYLGDKWLQSIEIVQVLVFAGIVHSLEAINLNIILAMGKPSWNLKLNFANTLANVLFFIVSVNFGIVAVALSFTVRSYLFYPIRILLINKLLSINYAKYALKLAPPLFSSVISCFLIIAVKALLPMAKFDYIVSITLMAASIAIVYLLMIFLISPDLLKQVRDISKTAFSSGASKG